MRLAALSLVFALSLFAQMQSRLTGVVTDHTGAVIVGAGITVTNTATGTV